jgi:hypothetical protein
MTDAPFHRISQAVLEDSRQFMLALDTRLAYIVVDFKRNILVHSTLTFDQRSLAAEWAAEVSRDITKAMGGDPAEVYRIILDNL